MADRAERRRQPAGRKSRQSQPRKSSSARVTLEKVLGISPVVSSFLTSDPNSGRIAYPAGCVVVLLDPLNNKQDHIINASRKPFTALSFSPDGKHLVTGESGHMPCVRVWEVGGGQVAEVQAHKYGVACVAFSCSGSYVVSVGFQHDRTISVWDWRKGSIIATNKVSSRVFSVSVSQDSSYFVTAGNRHVKFWDLDGSKDRRVNSTVPLIGRSGLLGDHKNSVFCGVACGRGQAASNTYCVTAAGVLCLFNSSRQLEAFVNLKTAAASGLAVSEDWVFCGCADGVIRVFRPADLQYVGTLPRPHRLGVDLTRSAPHSSPPPAGSEVAHPDTLALTFDPRGQRLSCVYTDHSVYVWDVADVKNAGRLHSALYHSSCVWNIQVYPELQDPSQARLPPSSFLTCSSDNTIRLWHSDAPIRQRNQYSQDLLKILYVGEDVQRLQAAGERAEADGPDGKAGIRVLGISPDGKHLAAGDRCGNLRIFDLESLTELLKIEAHDSEVLCLEFSPLSSGVKLLASASRDRLIHVFNQEKNYNLQQTLNDHSASITAVKFTGQSPEVQLVSCGADKSIYVQTAEQTPDGSLFSRRHHVVEKTMLYDMDLDPTGTRVSVACQDRNVRVYSVETGKLERSLKGSASDEGALLKVHSDPSGSFFATSCSDKNITIFEAETGECVATLFGHSELVSCMRFSQDCRHLISASGDSCVFVWRLDPQMSSTMRKRRAPGPSGPQQPSIRRETFITVPAPQLPLEEEEDQRTPGRPEPPAETLQLETNGKMPMWFRKLADAEASSVDQSEAEPSQVRSRWAEPLNPLAFCSGLNASGSHEEEEEEEEFQPQSLDSLLGDEEEEEVLQTSRGNQTFILQSDCSPSLSDRDFKVEAGADPALEVRGQGAEPVWRTHPSPDSACSEGSTGSLEPQHDTDTDSLSQCSSVGSLGPEDDEDRNSLKNHFESLASSLAEERFNTDLTALRPAQEKPFLNPRLSISTRFLSRFQDRLRSIPRGPALPDRRTDTDLVLVCSRVRPGRITGRISEESNSNLKTGSELQMRSEPSGAIGFPSSTRGENGDKVGGRAVLSRRASCGISHEPRRRAARRRHTVLVLRCKKTLGDVTSRTANSGAASSVTEESRLAYLDIAKPACCPLEENKENHQAPPTSPQAPPTSMQALPTPPQALPTSPQAPPTSPQAPPTSPQAPPHSQQEQSSSTQVLATPPEVTSRRAGSGWSAGSLDETPTNPNRTLIQSPAPPAPPGGLKGAEPGSPTDPDISAAPDSSIFAPPTSSSSPMSERLRPQADSGTCLTDEEGAEPVSLQRCQQAAIALRQATQRAVLLYRQQVCGSERSESCSVLQEAAAAAHRELQAVLPAPCSGAPSGQTQDEQTMSLLEKYSELLVQMTQNKLNKI
ncbi:WD repeat-containing protein 62 isoform X4 [Poecilia reticulata]|uniref:WD repeat-containing protein 62 isoform X4 n=1 Tax=Poecilia reticulata TaxID=8081 RepID=UPI0004A48BE7|nr:PREDICTED: mitogen-activated protein kinase-binding protein 1-like isoform X4 [Poecilia reticulata]